MAMVGTESLDTITKKEASELIGKLKKTIQKIEKDERNEILCSSRLNNLVY